MNFSFKVPEDRFSQADRFDETRHACDLNRIPNRAGLNPNGTL